MLDFVEISRQRTEKKTKTIIDIFPTFLINGSTNDLMIRGRDFYAVWDEDNRIWSTSEQTVIDQIDHEVELAVKECQNDPKYEGFEIRPKFMRLSNSGLIDQWHKYVQKQCRDHFHQLDEKLIFANTKVMKRDYSSKRLNYDLEDGDISAWNELMGVLYSPSERDKLEWAIGAVVSGDSKKIQKCIYLYGGPKTGKSTFLDIVKALFDGYYCVFDATELGNSNASFALESFKDNPLVGIHSEGNLSRIDDNTRLNAIISHELMEVNEKFKAKYTAKFNTFLFIASNSMVKITDAKSGLVRRIIDVTPTGNTVSFERYTDLMGRIINDELGHIAKYCLDRYNSLGINYYSKYVPKKMIEGTNEFYNFVQDMFFEMEFEDRMPLKTIWAMYKKWCDDSNIKYPMSKNAVRNELMNYFNSYEENSYIEGRHERSVFSGFHREKFESAAIKEGLIAVPNKSWLDLHDADPKKNVFNTVFADCQAQLAIGEGKEVPSYKWENVKTVLQDIDTEKVHYVRTPEYYIHIDFDKKDNNGKKSLEENLKAASAWPPTYAETSKGGEGLHLTYKYVGDVSKLSPIFDEDIEIKVCTGKASLRRRLSKCNDISISTISSGLPLKGGKKVIDLEVIKNENILRKFIINCLNKKHHGATAPEIDYIYSELEKCYRGGVHYDVSDMKEAVIAFAASSTNQAQKCLNVVGKMHFKSEDSSEPVNYPGEMNNEDAPIIFFDVEVFPNLFVLCYKIQGEKGVGLINPNGEDIFKLCEYRLVGFNNRKYDNHILYARMQGYSIRQLYELSQKIILDKSGFFGEAYNLSYTDIYDFASSGNKMSLKKWEIKLGIHHQELGLPWDQDVPEELWDKVVEYCLNDIDATEAAFNCDELHADFVAREILADIAGMTPNDTTNQLTTKIIFGDDKHPQGEFVYTDLSTIFPGYEFSPYGIDEGRYTGKIVNGKSIYRGNDPSEGGRVYAEPGMYFNVALLDIASMHPSSIENLNLFGDRYTKRFSEIKTARLYIKHKEFDKAKELFDGKLVKYLDDPAMAKALSNALKTAINSVYGLTSAGFDNKFRDPRNRDNIVAKRGALFMIELQLTLQEMGYTVVHVKTDSIKIAGATPEVINFVTEFGKKYGYVFEHEATYERLCLVNESTYIAYDGEHWTATGAQFAVPYVFKTLFSHEPIIFEDMCETKSVTTALYLDFNEKLGEDEHQYQFVGRVGLFCPMMDGAGGGLLLREKDGKYSFTTGSKGYRWMEAEMVKNLHKEDQINREYYDRLCAEAKETINKFGDFEMFVSDLPF